MATDWPTVALGEVAVVKSGYAFKSKDWTESGVPVVKIANVKGGRLEMSGCSYVEEATARKAGEFILSAGDILIAMTGYIGDVARVRRNDLPCVLNQRVGKFSVRDPKRLDPDYLYSFLSWAETRRTIEGLGYGSAQPNVSPSLIHKVEMPLPPLPEQKAIARILGTLDDKIELNRRMNATLEAMARALFRSWFVDFDPVRRKSENRKVRSEKNESHDLSNFSLSTSHFDHLFPDSFQSSELGEIPRGWTVKSLPEVIEVNPRRTLSKGAIAPYLDMKNLPTQGHCAEEVVSREFGSGTKFKNGDTLLARITPCLENGKTGFVDFLQDGEVGWGSTEYIVFAPKPPLPPQFGYLLARSEKLRTHAIQNMTGTSGRQRVPAECFNSFLLAVPSPEIAKRFGELVAPLFAKIKSNTNQSRTLATLRDTLLPKLLSGELNVIEIEKNVLT